MTFRGGWCWDTCLGSVSRCLSPFHSRNQLSSLPPYICQLPLRVLIVSNNKLGALPPDISTLGSLRQLVRTERRARRGAVGPGTRPFWGEVGERPDAPYGKAGTEGGGQRLRRLLMLLGLWLLPASFLIQDVSSNELQSLPTELCSLPSLRDLNVRRNQLSTLPDGEEKEERWWERERHTQTETLLWRSQREGIFTEK